MIVSLVSGGLHHRWRGTSCTWSEGWSRRYSGFAESQQTSSGSGLWSSWVRSTRLNPKLSTVVLVGNNFQIIAIKCPMKWLRLHCCWDGMLHFWRDVWSLTSAISFQWGSSCFSQYAWCHSGHAVNGQPTFLILLFLIFLSSIHLWRTYRGDG